MPSRGGCKLLGQQAAGRRVGGTDPGSGARREHGDRGPRGGRRGPRGGQRGLRRVARPGRPAQARQLAMSGLSDAELQELYTWVDKVPLSRPKRNIARDFSDGGKNGWRHRGLCWGALFRLSY